MTTSGVVDYEMSHDDMVGFARAMFEVAWQYSDDTGEHILSFFESPHKWDVEYQKWRELGGTLEKDCLRALEHYLDHRNDPEEDEDE